MRTRLIRWAAASGVAAIVATGLQTPGTALAQVDAAPVPGDRHRPALAPQDVPKKRILTPGGDEHGYARMPLPYTRDPRTRITGALFNEVELENVPDAPGYCTASVISSWTRDLLVTAAHCVTGLEKGKSHHGDTGSTFVPAYNKWGTPAAPYGEWEVTDIWVPPNWYKNVFEKKNKKYSHDPSDIAVLRVENDEGQGIQNVVGSFTPLLNRSGSYRFTSLGYPGDDPYNGYEMMRCEGRSRLAKDRGMPVLETNNCQLYGGNSGGPWITRYRDYQQIGVLSSSDDAYESDPSSIGAPMAYETFGKLLRRADPDGTRRGQYDSMSIGPAKELKAPKSAARGRVLSYRIPVQLSGYLAHADVPVTVRLGPGQRYVSAKGASCTSARGTLGKSSTVRCTLRHMHPGASQFRPVVIKVTVAKNAPAKVTATATVVSSPLDPNKKDNTRTLTVAVRN